MPLAVLASVIVTGIFSSLTEPQPQQEMFGDLSP